MVDDFWTTLRTPGTPLTHRKTLQVTPILFTEHNRATAEYLVDNKSVPYQSITQVHIVELLAGIPWTET